MCYNRRYYYDYIYYFVDVINTNNNNSIDKWFNSIVTSCRCYYLYSIDSVDREKVNKEIIGFKGLWKHRPLSFL